MTSDAFRELFGRTPALVDAALGDLDEDQLATRLDPEANSIAWLIWHLTRVQDDHVASAAATLGMREFADQLYPDGYSERFALPFPVEDHGYGHSSADVGSVRASGALLADYHRAVSARTDAFLAALPEERWQEVVDGNWNPPVTLLVRIASVASEVAQHVGQAAFIRGVLDRR